MKKTLTDIERLVTQLQSDDSDPNTSLKTYEKIVTLSEVALKKLAKQNDKLTILTAKANQLINTETCP